MVGRIVSLASRGPAVLVAAPPRFAISSHEMTTRVAAIVALVQLAAAVARADPAADALALAHLESGVAAYRAGDLAHAHLELTAAQQLAPDRANPYRWLALTEAKLG